MGRRSPFGHLLRDLSRVADRAAAEARRQHRRIEGLQARALEREIVRQERAFERERVRAERAAERERIQTEREDARREKVEAKQAQLDDWRLEYEEHQGRDREIQTIANESPEVEDRAEAYAALLAPRPFEFEPFTPPPPVVVDPTRIHQIRARAIAEAEAAAASCRPLLRKHDIAITAAGVALPAGLGAVVLGGGVPVAEVSGVCISMVALGCGITALFIRRQSAARQRDMARASVLSESSARAEAEVRAMQAATAQHNESELRRAEAAFQQSYADARRHHEEEEARRRESLSALLGGDAAQIDQELRDLLPLDLPVPCAVAHRVVNSGAVLLDVTVPEPSVIPAQEAKLLASGKVSYKDKSPKRLRDEYLRLVAGLALRHASEVMLRVPTCDSVQVRLFRSTLDPSTGTTVMMPALDAVYDYPTLAPMTMDGIDPVAALRHFRHRVGSGLQPPLAARG